MLTRRHLISGLAAMSAAATLPAWAGQICRTPAQNGERICQAGFDIGPLETQRQECDTWCWAACIQAVFGFMGRHVEQADIVTQLFGNDKCGPEGGTGAGIVRVINQTNWIDNNGNDFSASAEALQDVILGVERPDMVQQVVGELSDDYGLICGALGHATVVTVEQDGQPVKLLEFQVRDPWGPSPNKRILSAEEFSNRIFLCKVAIN